MPKCSAAAWPGMPSASSSMLSPPRGVHWVESRWRIPPPPMSPASSEGVSVRAKILTRPRSFMYPISPTANVSPSSLNDTDVPEKSPKFSPATVERPSADDHAHNVESHGSVEGALVGFGVGLRVGTISVVVVVVVVVLVVAISVVLISALALAVVVFGAAVATVVAAAVESAAVATMAEVVVVVVVVPFASSAIDASPSAASHRSNISRSNFEKTTASSNSAVVAVVRHSNSK
mmetsp:Transcript_5927/g.17061  ORF Transcript_5927/g.17061 Transcript_5927/m.17061 type:complete len:234 (+) Transcript_5927:2764-3465(+)